MFKSLQIFDKVFYNFCFNFFFTLIIASSSIHAQDPVFTQFYSNPVYLNPAFSGSNKCPRIVSNYTLFIDDSIQDKFISSSIFAKTINKSANPALVIHIFCPLIIY